MLSRKSIIQRDIFGQSRLNRGHTSRCCTISVKGNGISVYREKDSGVIRCSCNGYCSVRRNISVGPMRKDVSIGRCRRQVYSCSFFVRPRTGYASCTRSAHRNGVHSRLINNFYSECSCTAVTRYTLVQKFDICLYPAVIDHCRCAERGSLR